MTTLEKNGRQPQKKWMENDLKKNENGSQPKKINGRRTNQPKST